MAQHRARTADRDAAVEIINNAYAEGQLTDTERSTRVTKALKARTLLQLERVTLDLQQPPPQPELPTAPPRPPSLREQFRRNAADERNQWRHVPRWQKILIGALAAVCIGGLGAFAVFGDDDDRPGVGQVDQQLKLTAKGIGAFIDAYKEQFDTTRVVSATLATESVALKVPTKDGKARHEDWRYRDGTFEKVADARRNADEQGPIDLADVDLAQLESNIAKARATLNVEKPDAILVWVERYHRGQEPSVRIQVGNTFQELGMLTTNLAGTTVLDSSPFVAPPAQ